MDHELRLIRKKVESLRNTMIQTCILEGMELSDPKAVHLSQLLDAQLNLYECHVRRHYSGKLANIGALPFMFLTNGQVELKNTRRN